MPRPPANHEARRRQVCAVCLKRGSCTITLTILKRIRRLPGRAFYRTQDPQLPGGICQTCRVRLSRADLTADFKSLPVPELKKEKIVRSGNDSCACRWCGIAKRVGRGKKGRPRPTVRTDRNHPKPEQISVETCHAVQLKLGLSTNGTLQMASVMRSKHGRAAVQPYLKKKLEAGDRQLDGWFSVSELSSAAGSAGPAAGSAGPAAAVVCTDTSGFLQHVINKREIDPHDHLIKIGMDGGGGILKVTCNIVTQVDNCSNDTSSRSVIRAAPFKDTSVKQLFLLAVVPGVPESYSIMAHLLQDLRLHDIGRLHIAADLKMANILCGLQVCLYKCYIA